MREGSRQERNCCFLSPAMRQELVASSAEGKLYSMLLLHANESGYCDHVRARMERRGFEPAVLERLVRGGLVLRLTEDLVLLRKVGEPMRQSAADHLGQ